MAAMHVNDWDASDAIKEAVETGELPTPADPDTAG